MAADGYDVIVVGARCAGSPTAMLLARKGYKVLVVDRATFPSDTLSTHLLHAPTVAALRRWGLFDRLVATGCPPIETYKLDFGPLTISGVARPAEDGSSTAYAPRRTVLDKLLVDAAAEAGAEVREGFTVDEILVEDGCVTGIRGRTRDGTSLTERARIVIGADGRHSRVAEAVKPEQYNEKPRLQHAYYTYWSNLPMDGMEVYIRPDRGFGGFPTNDGLTIIVVGWPYAEADAYKHDVEGNYLKTLELVPEFAERVRHAKREERFTGGSNLNFFRKPFGNGWALVGDAGYEKDNITAQGINDAFRDAELCVTALDEAFTGSRSYEEAMADYHRVRDERAMPIYEFTTQMATLEPPPPELQQLLGAVHGNAEAMSDFVSMLAGTVSPAEFFAEENIGRIMAGVAAIAS
jgi:2-polyprenyl-6-methoxyphenol hydroxylase-like FAD-dependent oxidoreductase